MATDTYEERAVEEKKLIAVRHAAISNLAELASLHSAFTNYGYKTVYESARSCSDITFCLGGIGGREIHFAWSKYGNTKTNDRVNISGTYKRGVNNSWLLRHNETAPSITVSLNRPIEALLKDIARRFLPAYEELYAVIEKRATEEIAASNKLVAHAKKIATLIGAKFDPERALGGAVELSAFDPYLAVRVHHDSVTLREVSDLTDEKLAAIVAIIRSK